MSRCLSIFLLLIAGVTQAQDKINFLSPPVVTPAVGTPIVLTPDLIDIVSFSTPLIVVASPDGVVSISPETGPIRIRGRFVDNPTKIETRTFSDKFLYVVEPKTQGRTELLVWPVGAPDAKSVIRRLIDSQIAPQPPPNPPPDPKPPTPNPIVPIQSDKLRVLYLYESNAALTPVQNGVLNSTIPRTTIMSAGGTWYAWDKGVDPTGSNVDEFWKEAWKRDRKSLPWIVIGSPKGFYEGPLPSSVDELNTLIKKYI